MDFWCDEYLNYDSDFDDGQTTLTSDDHFKEHNARLELYFENQQFCDITLVSSDDKYKVKAHKIFLASVSKYFDRAFAESNSSEVSVPQINGDSLKLILNFIYKGVIHVSADTVKSVLEGSHILELSVLKKLCYVHIKKILDVSNCLGIADLAQRHNCNELYEHATWYVSENFPDLRHTNEFKLLSIDQLCGLIARDDLRASSEYDIFESILEWINYRKDDRTQYLKQLLTYVRYPLLSPSFIGKIIEKTGESIETLRIVNKAFTWHAAPSWRSTIFPREQSKIRNFEDVIIAISGFENSETDLRVGLYYSGLKEWVCTKWPAVPYSRKKLLFTIVNNRLLIASGAGRDNEFTNRVDCLDLETLEWTEFPELIMSNESRKNAMITSDGEVYVFSHYHIYTIGHPFKNWTSYKLQSDPFEERPIPHFTSSNSFGLCDDHMYYTDMEARYYYVYNMTDCCHMSKIERLQSSPIIGVHTMVHSGRVYLIEIMKEAAVAYDLESNEKILHNDITFDETCSRTALHGENIILYGENRMYEYNFFTNQMLALPTLPKFIDNVDVVF